MITLVTFSMVACGESEKSSGKKETGKSKSGSSKLSDDVYDFEVMLDGDVFKLPLELSEFEEAGWKTDDDLTVTNDPGYGNHAFFTKGDQEVDVELYNKSMDVKPLKECQIIGISTFNYDNENKMDIELAKGIKIGSTMDEVTEAYGEPTEIDEYDSDISYIYSSGENQDIELMFEGSEKVTNISVTKIDNEKAPEAAVDSKEVPKVVSNYKTPESLGDDLYSFNVKYSGSMYTIPAPVSAFEANGWKIEGDTSEVVPAQGYPESDFEMRKDNKFVRISIKNYSDKATTISNCFITSIETDKDAAAIPIELPKGITENSKGSDVLAAYGEPTDKYESSFMKSYGYGDYDAGIEFTIDSEDDTISSIEINVEPEELK